MTTVYHVTDRANLEPILRKGLAGGWGDDGFGVYVYSDLADAESYAADHGWDGGLNDPVILEIEAPDTGLYPIDIHPEWPNPEDYENVLMHPMDADREEFWMAGKIRELGNEDPAPDL